MKSLSPSPRIYLGRKIARPLRRERFRGLEKLTPFYIGRQSTPPTYWSELTAEEFNRLLAVNTTGSFLIAQAAARQMLPRKFGAIVLASSTAVIAGTTGGPAGSGGPAYVASKAAIIGLVRSLARALGAKRNPSQWN
jgi:NAD(P)-dependent dehydrogenase (short-subunit alcohol dehydrogenase family)